MSELRDRLARLSPEQRAELQRRLAAQARPAGAGAIPRRATAGPAPVSFSQRRLWFLDRLEPGGVTYNVAVAVRLTGALAPAALAAALSGVVARHEALRTTFAEGDGEPLQVVGPPAAVPLPAVDLSRLEAAGRERELARLGRSQQPFDLARGPLLRARLARVGPEEHLLFLTLHHIVADGWSMGVLVREVAVLYRAAAEGRPLAGALPELPIQYPDFATWQREWLAGERLEHLLAHWRGRLAGPAPALDLPTDRSRPPQPSYRGQRYRCRLDAGRRAALERLAEAREATLFMALLAGLDALLGRLTGQRDLWIGSPIANRERRSTEGLIGFFVNTLVLRVDLAGDPSFATLLERAREVALEAYAHQEMPFERLVEELQPERDLSRQPLFQVMLVLHNAPGAPPELPGGLSLEPADLEPGTAKFDLIVTGYPEPAPAGGLGLTFEYAGDLFDRTTVARLAGQLTTLLAAAVAEPGRRLSELPLLPPAQRHQLRVEWPAPAGAVREEEPGIPLGGRFEAAARRHPEAVALVAGDLRLSYRELDDRTERLGRYLGSLGVAPEVAVGVLLPREGTAVEALLAVIKAGGICVPLDPAYPEERLRFILADAAAPVLVTTSELAERFAGALAPGTRVVRLDAEAGVMAGEEPGTPPGGAGAESLLYVIYTSGSTGRPKGVAMPHRALGHLLDWHLESLLAGARTLQYSALGFDLSFYEMFLAWLSGGPLVLVPEPLRRDPEGLARLLAEAAVEKVILPVAVLHPLAEVAAADPPAALREVTSTAEALQMTPLLRAFFEGLPGATLYNQYGPSECHVVTSWRLPGPPAGWPARPPVGRPVASARIYLTDPRLRLLPAGVPGEVVIGGPCQARGYLGRAAQSARAFVPDPLSGRAGARLYRTGDLARFSPEGNLEILGRIDDQVKVRGLRIELGEVESALAGHPAVERAAVALVEERLVAWVVPAAAGWGGGESLDGEALRRYLATRLPEPMLPAAFVTLDALPLTASGKVDRRALPAPGAGPERPGAIPPRTPMEELVAGVWSELLGVEVGAHDPFFELGGHSLLATRVVSRLGQLTGVELPVRALFEAPTVAALAERLEAARSGGAGLDAAPPLLPAGDEAEADPASFAQERLWFLDRLQPGSAAYHLPAALLWRGPLERPALAGALTEVAARQASLRTTFARREGRLVQVVAPAAAVPLPVVDLSALPGPGRLEEARRLARREARRPFDLARGPLLRATLLALDENEHALLVTQHHVVTDGWSLGLLVGELAALYRRRTGGKAAPLPELAVSYGDFARWQRRWLAGEVLARELAFWRRRLAGAPEELALPTDRPRPAVASARGGRRQVPLPAELAAALEGLGRSSGATLFMVLLTGFAALLQRFSGQTDLVVGTPVANRRRPEVEGLIGLFVNTLALRLDAAGATAFSELLAGAREAALAAYDHQDLPFEKLVEELQPARSLGRSPLFQVMLALQSAPAGRLELPGVSLGPLDTGTGAAQFDLSLSVERRTEGGFTVLWFYRADLFDGTTVERMARGLVRLLAAAAAEPERSIAALPLLAAAERAQLLAEWSGAARPAAALVGSPAGGAGATLPRLVAAQVERSPEAVALVWGLERLTFAGLDERSGGLAGSLRRRGVGPEVRVGVLTAPSLERVAALLAVLRAGGAYLPLDPAYPRERLAFMIRDSGAALVVTAGEAARLVEDLEGVAVLRLETLATTAPEPAEPFVPPGAPEPSPRNLAYLIYTSGSTGRPKGVALEHAGAVALLAWAAELLPPAARTGVLAATSICFDLSVFELFVPLTLGGTAVLADNALHLPGLPAAAAVTLVNTVPSVLDKLLRLDGGLPPSVRWVCLAGEPLPRGLAEAIHRRPGVEALYNLYGPSESTTYSTAARVPREEGRPPAIGRPVDGTRAYLLDRRLEPVPVGVAGRLLLAGAGLARGYHARPALTAKRFLPDPFAAAGGGRLYDTGDLARFRADGELEFLGRRDHQVKLRGFRVELGEVEAALADHPGVAEAAAIVARTGVAGAGGDARLVAYVAGSGEAPPAPESLRAHLRRRLPEAMVPQLFVPLPALPRTPNGKLDRRALAGLTPAPAEAAVTAEAAPAGADASPTTPWQRRVARVWRRVLGLEEVGLDRNFFDLGGHSLLLVEVYERLRDEVAREGRRLAVVDLFQHPTVRSLAAHLADGGEEDRPRRRGLSGRRSAGDQDEIAVVGLALRFPGADDPRRLWHNLRRGVESVTFFDPEELAAAGVEAAELADPAYVPAAAGLEGVELFDAGFFGFNPLEASILDPQQRIFLEVAWQALEDTGYDPRRYPGRIGVFAGVGLNTYAWSNLAGNPEVLAAVGSFQAMFSSDKDYLATRVSYKLDLKGPSVAVQTACSTSLVAVHLAAESLRNGECEMALAGGVTVRVPQGVGYLWQEGSIASPDGHCRPFDARAAGTVAGSGAGVVVLKRLADARADGDTVRAVIKGSAINNDGALKVGFSAPSVEGQAEVIADALERAGVAPETVSYVECHGTATPLGDPIEVKALARAYGGVPRPAPLALGSVKSNFGHLDAAAGVAGLIKTVLALEHRELPPTLHFREPNPELDLAAGPFRIQDRSTPWPAPEGGPRRAGVSSFGLGGTNAHLVLEEAPPVEAEIEVGAEADAPSPPQRSWELLVLSARSSAALERAGERLAAHLAAHPELPLADVAFTLQTGRRAFGHRRIALAGDGAEASRLLAGRDPARVLSGALPEEEGGTPVAFLFSGQGSQHVGMGRALYQSEPVFRRQVDRAAELLTPRLGVDLRRLLHPDPGGEEEAARRLDEIALGQPALFVVEHALARLWLAWGITPAAMIGHSVGEYVAACLAGVLSLEDALTLVATRSGLMQELPAGRMLSLPLAEEEVLPLLGDELSLAALNAPSQSVVSGPRRAIEELAQRLGAEGVEARVLHVSVAGHSALMEPILAPYLEVVRGVELRPPAIPFVSNVTGSWITAAEATDPGYWVRHLRSTVRFADGVGELLRDPRRLLLEVGPGRALATLARQDRPEAAGRVILHSLPHPRDPQADDLFLGTALGRLWLAGVEVDWPALHGSPHGGRSRRRRRPLPTYPFERQRCWIEPRRAPAPAPETARRSQVADWFYLPSWRRTPAPPPSAGVGGEWLLFASTGGLGDQVAGELGRGGAAVTRVRPGSAFTAAGERVYSLAPGEPEGYRRLLAELEAAGRWPEKILHLWAAEGPAEEDPAPDGERARGFYSLVALGRALEAATAEAPPALTVVARGLAEVTGGEALRPELATLLGPARVLPQELAGVTCRVVDVLPPAGEEEARRLARRLVAEAAAGAAEPLVAYRDGRRWAEHFEPLPRWAWNGDEDGAGLALRPGGVYLVTGGLGRVGRVLAEAIARAAPGARLALTGRTPAPPAERWAELAGGNGPEAERARGLLELAELGAEPVPLAADVADPEAMAELLARVWERFGGLHGVIHAAGLVGRRALLPLAAAEREACEAQLRPKVEGARVLARLLEEGQAGSELDWVMLVSSLSTVLGGLGYAAYAAANHYLDAFARVRSRTGAVPWVSVAWDGWRFDEGEAGGDGSGPLGAQVVELAIRPAEGLEAARRLFALEPTPHLFIATADPEARRTSWQRASGQRAGQGGRDDRPEPRPEEAAGAAPGRPGGATDRPPLQVEYAPPSSELERRIAAAWSELLGIRDVGVHDDFFELGGHSVLATQVVARLRRSLRVEVPLATFFAYPTIAGLAAVLGEAVGAAARDGAQALEVAIPRRPRQPGEEELPLSFAQQRFWFLDQLEPGNPAYHVPFAFLISGPLSPVTLAAAFDALVARHESLRTAFPAPAGRPVQVIGPPRRQELPVIDLAGLPDGVRQTETARMAEVEGRAPFDLAGDPLLRTRLVRLAAGEWVLLLTLHHVISDHWSIGVLMQELAALYEAGPGAPSPLPELPVQYADFTVWQRQWFASGVLDEQIAYWERTLAGAPAALALPTDHPRPRVPSYRNASLTLEVPPAVTGELEGIARSLGGTLFMVLLAAFAHLLYRYSGQTDVLVGTPTANRTRTELEGLIGFFVNTLVLRTDLGGDPTFLELLERARTTVLGAQAHQDLPFERLVEALQPERQLGRTPLFQVLFALQTSPMPEVRVRGLTFRPVATEGQISQFDLSLNLVQQGGGLGGLLQYDADLFEATTVRRLAGHYRRLLARVAAHPEGRLAAVSFLAPGERRQLLGEWSATAPPHPGSGGVIRRFEARAAARPDAVAVVAEGRHLPYGELDAAAGRLAAELAAAGVGAESRVAICLRRSPELVAAVLAVMKAGGAYVPLDPDYGRERLAFMLADCRPAALLTGGDLTAGLAADGMPVLTVDGLLEAGVAQEAGGPPAPAASLHPARAAYLVYTSGSTGRPKGVVVSHGALENAYRAWEESYRLAELRAHLQMASFSFDVFSGDLVRALCSGGRLVLCPRETLLEPERLAELSRREGVDAAEFVPAVARGLAEHLAAAGATLAGMRLAVVGSDVWSLAEYRTLAGLCPPGCRLVSSYGVSEATIDSTRFEAAGTVAASSRPVPIGRPFAGCRVHPLDRRLAPVPAGVPGELLLGGAGLARGYHDRPALTAERFIPDPFARETDEPAGGRLYRTGDLVRFLADGQLELLGRVDLQVKVRGFRIEPGEVETVLCRHPGVARAAVAVHGEGVGKRLVGYLVPAQEEETPAPEVLRAFLARELPEHMVPQAFVALEALPLTPNGKVDRRALPAPPDERPELAEGFVAPRNAMEEQLAAIWCQVLGLDRVGIHDNFFQVGGHSLLATQVVSRVRSELGVAMPVAALFESPTIAGLAEAYWRRQAERDEAGLAALLAEVDELSVEEAEALLAQDGLAQDGPAQEEPVQDGRTAAGGSG